MKKSLIFLALIICCVMCFVACDDEETDNTNNNTENQQEQGGGFVNPGDQLGGGKEGTIPTEQILLTEEETSFEVDLTSLKQDVNMASVQTVASSTETVMITTAGNYLLAGIYEKGVVVTVGNNETTHLFLNGATIQNEEGIALSNTNKKSNLIITLVANSTNTVSNNGEDVNAIHVKGNLSMNGYGKLSVESKSKSGIKVSKKLQIADAEITIDSQNHGISANGITIQDASVTVSYAAKDGLNSECDDETTEFPDDYSEGYILLKDTRYSCFVDGDGMQADTLVSIDGGEIDITTNGIFVPYSQTNITLYELVDDDFRYSKNGTSYQKVASDYNGSISKMYALKQSCKGIKVGEIKYENEEGEEIAVTEGKYLIVIDGETTVSVDSTDDAVHTNSGSLYIKEGTITVSTMDDGFTGDYLTQIDGGTINVQTSYEGVEGAYVKINGGTINIVSTDDGINAASDDTTINEYIIINGGTITVNASGDGIDSNGSVLMTGGTLTVYGPTSGADAGLDSETGIIIQGGTVFASSSLGMTETPSSNSTQYLLSYAQSTALSAGSTFVVKNSDGEEIFSTTLQKVCQTITFSSPLLQKDATYTICGNDTELGSFTVADIITSVGSDKNAGAGNQQGGMGQFDPNRQGGNGGGGMTPPDGQQPTQQGGQPTPPDGQQPTQQNGGQPTVFGR